MKQVYQLTLDEWEALLDKGPVRLKHVIGHVIISKQDGCYCWRVTFLGGHTDTTCDTLVGLFLQCLFQALTYDEPVTVDADHEFVAMLPGGER